MKPSKAFWATLIVAIGGCTQILELDQEYRPSGAGGAGGAGGSSPCVVTTDCTASTDPCIVMTCENSACVPGSAPAGTACGSNGAGVCDGNGTCGDCNVASDCTMLPPDDECQARVCTDHVCSQSFTTAGTKLAAQTMGDCLDVYCDGAGKTTTQPNDADLPDDNNPCTQNICTNGAPSHPLESEGTNCGTNALCNNSGQCVGCLLPTDCMGTDDFCKKRTCTNQVCGFDFTAAGTDAPTGQTTGDCKIVECDGQGNLATNPDNADISADSNPCTKDVCSNGTLSHPPETAGTTCPGGTCNGAGSCVKPNGAVCTAGTQCQSGNCADGRCCDMACGQTCKSCAVTGFEGQCTTVPAGFTDDSCAAPKSCDGTTGASSCVSLSPNGTTCGGNANCGSGMCVDGICCSSTCTGTCKACNVAGSLGTCSNVAKGADDVGTCSGVNSCDGNGVCKKDNGQACAASSECVNGICVDGVCCNNSCTGTCMACNVAASVGTCSNVPAGQEDGATCSGVNSCNGAGMCLLDDGQPCTLPTECSSGLCTANVCGP